LNLNSRLSPTAEIVRTEISRAHQGIRASESTIATAAARRPTTKSHPVLSAGGSPGVRHAPPPENAGNAKRNATPTDSDAAMAIRRLKKSPGTIVSTNTIAAGMRMDQTMSRGVRGIASSQMTRHE